MKNALKVFGTIGLGVSILYIGLIVGLLPNVLGLAPDGFQDIALFTINPLVVVTLVYLVNRYIYKSNWQDIGIKKISKSELCFILKVLGVMLIVNYGFYLLLTIGNARWIVPQNINFVRLVLDIVIGLFSAAITEELIFRGFIQSKIDGYTNQKWLIYILPSLVFTLLHFNNFTSVEQFMFFSISTLLWSFVLVYLRDKTGNILLGYLFHAITNAISGIVFIGDATTASPESLEGIFQLQISSQLSQWISGGESGTSGSIILMIILFGVTIWYINRKEVK